MPHPAYFNGSDQQSAAPDSPATHQMYRLGTSGELSEPPGTTARSSSSRQNRRDGAPGVILGLDSNLFIYALEANRAFGSISVNILKACQSAAVTPVISEIVFIEIMSSSQMVETDAIRAKEWLERLGFKYVPIGKDILVLAAHLRRQNPALKTPDAIHIATALGAGVTYFITNDQKLLKKKIIGIELVPLAKAVSLFSQVDA